MDERSIALKEKLEKLLKESAEISVELDRANGTIQGVPHYSLIEARAHELGQQLSREIQQRHMGHVAAEESLRRRCPGCGKICDVEVAKRPMTSIDGSFELPELKGSCPACRRDFFPSA
jgi:ABC-type ATPase with predicted acetyltransferase domain